MKYKKNSSVPFYVSLYFLIFLMYTLESDVRQSLGLMRTDIQIECKRCSKVYGTVSMWQDLGVGGGGGGQQGQCL